MEMARSVKRSSKRAYDSSRRQAQARETQGHIAFVARGLFVARGYQGTSIRDIAEEAGVAVQTIYNLFGGKRAILVRVLDIAVVGDDEAVALAEREELQTIMASSDPGAILDRWSQMATGIFVRFLPLLPVIREAASSDAELSAQWRANTVDNRYAGTRDTAAKLHALRALPKGMTIDRAADLMFAYASFDTAEALILQRGWTPDEYAERTATTFRTLFDI